MFARWTTVGLIVHEILGGIIEEICLGAQLFIDGHQTRRACTSEIDNSKLMFNALNRGSKQPFSRWKNFHSFLLKLKSNSNKSEFADQCQAFN